MKDLEKSVVLITRTTQGEQELLRVKIQEIAAMAAEKTELEGLQREVEEAQNASVKAQKAVYPGVSIGIDELKISVQDMQGTGTVCEKCR